MAWARRLNWWLFGISMDLGRSELMEGWPLSPLECVKDVSTSFLLRSWHAREVMCCTVIRMYRKCSIRCVLVYVQYLSWNMEMSLGVFVNAFLDGCWIELEGVVCCSVRIHPTTKLPWPSMPIDTWLPVRISAQDSVNLKDWAWTRRVSRHRAVEDFY